MKRLVLAVGVLDDPPASLETVRRPLIFDDGSHHADDRLGVASHVGFKEVDGARTEKTASHVIRVMMPTRIAITSLAVSFIADPPGPSGSALKKCSAR